MTLTEFTTWILIIIACGSSVVCSPPRINVTSEYVMDVSSQSTDLLIHCEAQQNVTWTWTAPLDDETVKDYLSITYTHHESTDHPFVSVLKLESPHSTDTGYYACQHNNAADLNDQQNTDKTYVYVFDGDRGLAVPTELLTVSADTSDKLTLPCHVTKPTITVQLIFNEEDISSNRNDVTWNPKVGFILRNLAVADSGLYQCKPNGYNDSVSFYVTITPAKDELDPPAIHYLPSSNFVVNYSFTLECIKSNNSEGIRLHWNFPRIDEKDAYTITNTSKRQGDQEYLLSSLTIKSATIKDKGEYKCTVSATGLVENSDIYKVNIKETLEPYINLTERDRIEVTEGGDVDWRTDVLAFPPNPQVIYRYYDGREVNDEDERITIEHHSNQADSWLRIKNVTNNDFGVYFLEAISNDGETRRSTKTLIQVTSKPYTSLSLSDVIADNRSVTVECSAKGFPIENVNTTWQIEYCPVGLHTCKGQFTEILQLDDDANSTWPENEGNVMRSFIRFMPEASGQIKCKSQNVIGETSTTKVIRISDIDEAFSFTYILNHDLINVEDIKKKLTIIENDQFHLLCGGIKFDFKAVDLKKNEGSSLIDIEDSAYSMIRKVSQDKVTKQYKGTYICTAVPHDTSKPKLVRILDVNVQDELAPYFWGDPNMATNGKLDIEEGQKLVLSCSVRGMPKPEIDWYKDNELFTVDKNNEEIHMSKNLTILEFKFLKESHSGTYKCRAKNRKSHIEGQKILQVYKSQTLSKGAIIGLLIAVALIIAMIVLVIWLFIRVKKEKELKNEFRKNELYLFEKGNVGDLNQDCMADEQAQLLPYDKQWEIPRDDIEIGKQLGEGAFGRVVKALVQNLNDDNKGKITAVKMCKNQADPSQVRSLAGELKIMIHLGKHLNIVNLIGASTVNISKGELLVLVEYCPYGDLLKFMLQHRHQFINQVQESDRIDPAIMTVSSPISAGIIQRTSSVRSAIHPLKKLTDQDGYLAPSFCGNSQVSINEKISSSGSNYDALFSTTTLVLWAWQVAQGMQYLAKRKVLHGDLAARNLLLSENNVVKISDFGLSRDIYKKDVYLKKGDDLMPIKWMSIEAIRDRIFSVQSDVWAFGVTLWEIFTLSSTPYPGIEFNKDFIKLLDEDGYRMEQPKYSNKELYAIILDCWQSEPRCRPTYQAISERLENLLPKELFRNFIDMNDINLQLNRKRFENGTDYLQMMGSLDYENITKQERNEDDNIDYTIISHVNGDKGGSYLNMQTTAGNSKVGVNPEYANADTIAMMRQTSSDHTLNNSNYLSMSQQRVSQIPNTDVFSPSHFPCRERTHTVSSQPSNLEETQEEVYHQDQDLEFGNPDNIDNGRIMYMDRGNNEHISLLQTQNSNMNSGRTRLYSNGQDEVDFRNPDNINNGGMVYMDRGNNEHISLLQKQNLNMNGGRRRLYSNGSQNGDIIDYMDEQTE